MDRVLSIEVFSVVLLCIVVLLGWAHWRLHNKVDELLRRQKCMEFMHPDWQKMWLKCGKDDFYTEEEFVIIDEKPQDITYENTIR